MRAELKEIINIDVRPSISDDEIFHHFSHTLPKFKWRRGDSDMQGPYLSGVSPDYVDIQVWLGEKPITVFISFTGAWPNDPDRDMRKQQFFEFVINDLILRIGIAVKIDA